MKKINKKGFTLVELLAVVVILAVLLIIAVPSVSRVLNASQESAARDNATMIAKAVETCIMAENTNGQTCNTTKLASYLEGTVPDGVEVVDGVLTKFSVDFKGYTITAPTSVTDINVSKLKSAIAGADFTSSKSYTIPTNAL